MRIFREVTERFGEHSLGGQASQTGEGENCTLRG